MKSFFYIHKFLKLPGTEKSVLIKGLLISFLFYFIIKLFPLKLYIHLLKTKSSSYHTIKSDFDNYQKLITKSISRLEKIIPWQMTCLNKVITARYLYRNFDVDSEIILSVFENSFGKRCAHASLIVEGTFEYLSLTQSMKTIHLLKVA